MSFLPGKGLLLSWGLLVSCLSQTSAAGRIDGYTYGQPMPVTCLNRTIDSGEHITDNLGKLQYIPFPTCNETLLPLALRYGVTETVNCTISSLPDELYHLLEYYVHSDVPMTCRIPTAPLSQSSPTDPNSKSTDKEAEERDEQSSLSVLEDNGPPYTPITFALQGTLQRSHLHIWTDMNVLAHNIPKSSSSSSSSSSSKKHKKGKTAAPGYIVAGTAYSVPEFDFALLKTSDGDTPVEKEASAVSEAAREPWTAGHGTKVIRGEPLTFTFHVSWVEGGSGIGWPSRNTKASPKSLLVGLLGNMLLFAMAASIGGFFALWWERRRTGKRGAWRGDGILGVPTLGKGPVGVSFGNGGKQNGYGGYSGGGGAGYGGFTSGKRD
ncbi:hypothetical protein AOCH_003633 [Aspergillus ochraceoroseus]|uniref:Uncharacterized protein n=1 Tax=Aspergillus ochraceoroseus TaxID=138278 RepID=A0A0F8UJA0_9EURO|nr:hypothetical protein AOCH_003633 [Aspergillus ochraceoroseus]